MFESVEIGMFDKVRLYRGKKVAVEFPSVSFLSHVYIVIYNHLP